MAYWSPPRVRLCSLALHRERHEAAALVLKRYPWVVERSVRSDGERVCFELDLTMLPAGDGASAEAMIVREVERHAKGAP